MRHERLGDIIDFIRGVTFTPQDVVEAHSNDSVVCLRTKNIQEQLELSDLIAIPKKFVRREEQYIIADDLLISSANSFELVGKTVFVPHLDFPAAAGGFISIVRPKKNKIFPRYLFHWINTPFIQNKIRYCGRKTTNISNLNKELFLDLEIKYPELEEQRRIAAILDKADIIRRKRQEALKLADALVKSRFIEMFGDPVTNPMGWGKVNLCDVAGIISGITKGRKISGKQTFPIPYMRVANVKDGYIDLSEIKMIEATPDEVTYYRLLKNDILMTEGGDPDKLGRGAIWFGQIENCIHQNHIFRVRLNNAQIHPIYFAEYLKQSVVKKYFLSCAKQTTGIASINMTQLKALPTIIPPLSLQAQFAAFVEQADKSKFAMQRQLAEAEASKASLMQQFFS